MAVTPNGCWHAQMEARDAGKRRLGGDGGDAERLLALRRAAFPASVAGLAAMAVTPNGCWHVFCADSETLADLGRRWR